MNADQVRSVEFKQRLRGYRIQDVDDFLEEVARAIDAGQPVAPMCDHVAFGQRMRGYDIEQVDRFLEQLVEESGS